MYSIVKNVLNQGGYDLTAIIKKIDTLWLQGKLTDEQHDELTETARNTADVQYSVDVLTKLEELDKRLTVLEKSDGDTSGEDTAEYPEYVVGKWYHNGEKCSFKGVNYVCIAPEGATCVWSPKDYPAYWEEVV